MGNQLVNLYRNVSPESNPLSVFSSPSVGGSNYNPQNAGTYNQQTQTETLPYGGGSFNPAGESKITPAPIFTGTENSKNSSDGLNYDKYKDPQTGKIMSPVEYANYLASKIPKGSGQISNYAGDAITNPNQSANELIGRATDLNNSRNDIATGTTDPYKVGSQSGIAYSPEQLKAIENAYAGIYDPALNDVFSRLKDKQAEDKQKADLETSMKAKVFSTNEAIRQWKATTGTGKSYNGSGGGVDDDTYNFSDTQLNKGASYAGMDRVTFDAIESGAIKNFYINMPNIFDEYQNKNIPFNEVFMNDLKAIENGEKTSGEVAETVNKTQIPLEVKAYLLQQIPKLSDEEKKPDGFWGNVGRGLSIMGDLVTGKEHYDE